MPNLFRKFNEEGYLPQIYAPEWFLTFFAADYPLEVVTKIMDIYLIEGRKTIFKFALAILKINEKELLKADFEGFIRILGNFKITVDVNQLLRTGLKQFNFNNDLIN